MSFALFDILPDGLDITELFPGLAGAAQTIAARMVC